MSNCEEREYELRGDLEEDEFSYFVKYDSVHGIAVSPDSGVAISKKDESCFDLDYKWRAACRLGVNLKFN